MKDMDWTVVHARDQFEGLLDWVVQAAQEETAVHEVERSLFRSLLALGRTLLEHFLAEKGLGDCGRSLPLDDGLLLLRGEVSSRPYRSIFGEVTIERYLYGNSEKEAAIANPSSGYIPASIASAPLSPKTTAFFPSAT